jgi:hypothetical protein
LNELESLQELAGRDKVETHRNDAGTGSSSVLKEGATKVLQLQASLQASQEECARMDTEIKGLRDEVAAQAGTISTLQASSADMPEHAGGLHSPAQERSMRAVLSRLKETLLLMCENPP